MWIVDLVLTITAIIALTNRSKLAMLGPDGCPGVSQGEFFQWKFAQIKSTDWFAWGVIGVGLAGGILLLPLLTRMDDALINILLVQRLIWLGFLTVSAVYGTQAAKLKKQAGITWPK